MDFKNKIEKYSIRKFKVGVGSALIGFTLLGAVGVLDQIPFIGDTFGVEAVHADEATPKPEGNVIARGEDGVPWELYENGYLLFKPESGKDTLTGSKRVKGVEQSLRWKKMYGALIKFIGFEGKVYLPQDSSFLFSTPYTSNGDVRSEDGSYFFKPSYLDSSKLDSSKVENMKNMFKNSRISNSNFSSWDVSKVKYMTSMFECSHFKNLDISNWNVSNVEDMYSMFKSVSLNSLDVSSWNVSKVTNMRGMFEYSNLETLNLGGWNTENVTSMSGIFGSMDKLTNLDISNWNLNNVDDVNSAIGLFLGDFKLKKLKIGDNFKSKSSSVNLFSNLSDHNYGYEYTNKWEKEDKSAGPFDTNGWHDEYLKNPSKLAGTWIREVHEDEALKSSRTEAVNTIKAEADKKIKEIEYANLLPDDVSKLKQQVEIEKEKAIEKINKAN